MAIVPACLRTGRYPGGALLANFPGNRTHLVAKFCMHVFRQSRRDRCVVVYDNADIKGPPAYARRNIF